MFVEMCRLNTFCGRFSLETGVIVIQILLGDVSSVIMISLAFVLWMFYFLMADLEKELRNLLFSFALVFSIYPLLLELRSGILVGGVIRKSATLVMIGIAITVVELVSNLCFSIYLFIYFHPSVGAITVLCVPITLYCLVVLISYYLQLRAGLTSEPFQTGVVYSVPGQTPTRTQPGTVTFVYSDKAWFARGPNDPLNRAASPEGSRPAATGVSPSKPARTPAGTGLSQGREIPSPIGKLPGYPVDLSRKPRNLLTRGTSPDYSGGLLKGPEISLPIDKLPGYPVDLSWKPRTLLPLGTSSEYPVDLSQGPEIPLPIDKLPGYPMNLSRKPSNLLPIGTSSEYLVCPSQGLETPSPIGTLPGYPMDRSRKPRILLTIGTSPDYSGGLSQNPETFSSTGKLLGYSLDPSRKPRTLLTIGTSPDYPSGSSKRPENTLLARKIRVYPICSSQETGTSLSSGTPLILSTSSTQEPER